MKLLNNRSNRWIRLVGYLLLLMGLFLSSRCLLGRDAPAVFNEKGNLRETKGDVPARESVNMTNSSAAAGSPRVELPAKEEDQMTIIEQKVKDDLKENELNKNIWVGTWGSAQLTAADETLPPKPGLAGNTYRQGLRVSIGGSLIRLKFSNEFGAEPLEIEAAYIAKLLEYGGSKIDPKSSTAITFQGGKRRITIPAGKTITSDPIPFELKVLDYVAVTTLFGKVPASITSHTASRSMNYLTVGNHVLDEVFDNYQTATSWYFLSDIDVYTTPEHFAVVCFGDSLTDGYGVQTNVIQRWTDLLAERLQEDPETRHISVINKGIGGNAIFGGNGPAAYKRFLRDVCEPAGVKYCIMLIGVNDIGNTTEDITDSLIGKYEEMIKTAHSYGIKVYGGTITPVEGHYYYSDLHEEIRRKMNSWIMSGKSGLDGVIDFAAALAEPARPSRMQARYANDYLHPSAAGYVCMAELIDLAIFKDR